MATKPLPGNGFAFPAKLSKRGVSVCFRVLPWLCASAIWAAAPAPHTVSASYSVSANGAHVAVMNETFESRNGSYRIVSESVPVGALALFQKPVMVVSSGQVTADGLRPERFEGRRPGGRDGREVKAEFDWQGERLTYSHDGKSETVALPAATQDRLSAMYQFMYHGFDGRQRLEVAMTDGRRLTHHQYVVTPNVEIDTPLGRMTTMHLVKQTEPDGTGTEIWLAPRHHFLPVKMVIRESNGARYEQIATRIDSRGPAK